MAQIHRQESTPGAATTRRNSAYQQPTQQPQAYALIESIICGALDYLREARLNDSRWRGGRYLAAGEMESKLVAIGQCTHTGRPLGTGEFVGGLEKMAQRRLAPQKRGHREKIVIDRAQSELSFDPLMIKIAVSRMGSQGPGSDLSHFPVFSNFSLQPF